MTAVGAERRWNYDQGAELDRHSGASWCQPVVVTRDVAGLNGDSALTAEGSSPPRRGRRVRLRVS